MNTEYEGKLLTVSGIWDQYGGMNSYQWEGYRLVPQSEGFEVYYESWAGPSVSESKVTQSQRMTVGNCAFFLWDDLAMEVKFEAKSADGGSAEANIQLLTEISPDQAVEFCKGFGLPINTEQAKEVVAALPAEMRFRVSKSCDSQSLWCQRGHYDLRAVTFAAAVRVLLKPFLAVTYQPFPDGDRLEFLTKTKQDGVRAD